MLKELFKLSNKNSQVIEFLNDINQNKNISIFDTSFNNKSWLINMIDKPTIFVIENFDLQTKMKEQLESFGKKVEVIMSCDFDLKLSAYKQDENILKLLLSLYKIINNDLDVLIVSSKVLFQRLPSKQLFLSNVINLEVNKNYNIKELVQKLLKLNYKKVDMVEQKGDFALRGDILDVYSLNYSLPIRIEFFDDQVESINSFNLNNYSKVSSKDKVSIIPNTILLIDNVSQIINKLDDSLSNVSSKLEKTDLMRFKTNIENIKFRLQNSDYNGIENFIIPYLNYTSNILSYFDNNAILVIDDVKQIYDRIVFYEDDFLKEFDFMFKNNEVFFNHKNLIFSKEEIFNYNVQKLSFQNITTSNRIFNPEKVYTFKQSSLTKFYGKYEYLFEELQYYLEYKNTVIIFGKDENISVHLKNFLESKKMYSKICYKTEDIVLNGVNIIPKNILYGNVFVEDKIVVIGVNELLGKQQLKTQTKKTKREVFTLPKIGDYVVHDIYGIGLCVGIERRKFASFEKDYVVLEYANKDKLYVPTEQIDVISSYVSSSQNQKLSKLGSQEFTKVKQRVKSSVKEMAFSLLKLYAEREQTKGFKYNEDDILTKEFENTFNYTLTVDQQEAVNVIKKEMEEGKLVDRLICGDVGYGKTEVALRAIFKAVASGKQVAFLAPTTILSQQHFNTCFARMNNFMVNVEVLNRFKTPKEQREVLKKLKEGKIDVIVGTHRLLSKDVEFKNLGLLVLDEEQRFGVQDKEKIKNIKKNIDVLTLSATPIPRTLHMSLSGIRDISLITTAPEGRMPVQTTVTEFSNVLLKQAIQKELDRNGQVIVVYNSIEHIYSLAESIRLLVGSDVSVGVAHGQMDEKTLENAIYDLYNGKTQILVSTTLIENGIDLPNANTLIVKNADRLGLSQLYQLRGRVGRGNKPSYAYFTYEKDKVMTEDAYKRLNALMEFTELGSGFKIALRDLEIRGCGNLMGKEQHGHMDKVGYDMYCKLLNEAVSEIKGEKIKSKKDAKIDITINAFIPNDYILESDERFRVYNMLIGIKNENDRLKILDGVKEMYGKNLPNEIVNLSKISLLRHLAMELDISKVQITNEKVKLEFYDKKDIINEKMSKDLSVSGLKYILNFNSIPTILFDLNDYSVVKKLDIVLEFLINCLK